jgi:hypothetical protein
MTLWIYQFSSSKWSQAETVFNNCPEDRFAHSLTAFEDSLYLFGGNPGGAVVSRFNDLWKLEIEKVDNLTGNILNILRILQFYNLIETNQLTQACLFLRSNKCENLPQKEKEELSSSILQPYFLPDYGLAMNQSFEKICSFLKIKRNFYNLKNLIKSENSSRNNSGL